ncbi:MAG: hypothetical protein JSR73_13770 [Proteobacteria bacterium]|nr:hypothetical protein [Pseudomonadota bacterium]
MSDTVLFVDLENVQKIDLGQVPAGARVMVFHGFNQKNMPIELVAQAQPLGARLQWIRIQGQGPNALDFHIAYYLGEELAQRPRSTCVILSADKGFDPLVKHLAGRGQACRRVATLKDAFPKTNATAPQDAFQRVLGLLQKEGNRPKKRAGLLGKIRSWFPKQDKAAHERLLEQLLAGGHVTESDGRLNYRF